MLTLKPLPMAEEESLADQKLKAEIKSLKRHPLATPAFWAPLFALGVAAFTYFYLLNTGLFEYKQAHLNFVTDTLFTRKKILDSSVISMRRSLDSVEDKYAKLQRDYEITDSVRRDLYTKSSTPQKELINLRIENQSLKSEKQNLTADNRRLFTNDSLNNFRIYQMGRAAGHASMQIAGDQAQRKVIWNQLFGLQGAIEELSNNYNKFITANKSAEPLLSDITMEIYRLNRLNINSKEAARSVGLTEQIQ